MGEDKRMFFVRGAALVFQLALALALALVPFSGGVRASPGMHAPVDHPRVARRCIETLKARQSICIGLDFKIRGDLIRGWEGGILARIISCVITFAWEREHHDGSASFQRYPSIAGDDWAGPDGSCWVNEAIGYIRLVAGNTNLIERRL